MEKHRPHYSLTRIKAQMSTVKGLNATRSAFHGAFALGMGKEDMVAVIQTITGRHFYKSMTTYNDHRVWQDVYHVPAGDLMLYIKFTEEQVVVMDFKLISFKEK